MHFAAIMHLPDVHDRREVHDQREEERVVSGRAAVWQNGSPYAAVAAPLSAPVVSPSRPAPGPHPA